HDCLLVDDLRSFDGRLRPIPGPISTDLIRPSCGDGLLVPGSSWTRVRQYGRGSEDLTARAGLTRQPTWHVAGNGVTIDGMRYDVLLKCDARPPPRHLATIYADDDDAARRLVAERWLRPEPELRLQIVRVDGDRLWCRIPRNGTAAS